MSATAATAISNAGKKAVHVKWAGKTIALGTFPAAEADEKCARAKALTRAWRSTMRPKPDREWVMLELEKLGVRVVSGRLGRKLDDDDEADGDGSAGADSAPKSAPRNDGLNAAVPVHSSMGGTTIENLGEVGSNAWGMDTEFNRLMLRRNSSLGFSMLNDGRRGSLGSLGGLMGFDSTDPTMLGMGMGGDQTRRSSSIGLGTLADGALGLSVNPNQHYEMLKLHHMNLLNEIQETTLMMNLYQQQQLQQQQQQLQQQATAEGLSSNPSFDNMLGQQHRNSLGVGGSLDFSSQQLFLQQQMMPNVASSALGGGVAVVTPSTTSINTGTTINAPKANANANPKGAAERPAGAVNGAAATTTASSSKAATDKKRQTKTIAKPPNKKAKTGAGNVTSSTGDAKATSEAAEYNAD